MYRNPVDMYTSTHRFSRWATRELSFETISRLDKAEFCLVTYEGSYPGGERHERHSPYMVGQVHATAN